MLFNLWGDFSELTDIVPSSSAPRIPASTIWILSSTAQSPYACDARSSTRWRSLASTPLPGGSPRTRWAQQQLADNKQSARECRLAEGCRQRREVMWPLDGAVSKGKSDTEWDSHTGMEGKLHHRHHSMMEWALTFYFLIQHLKTDIWNI